MQHDAPALSYLVAPVLADAIVRGTAGWRPASCPISIAISPSGDDGVNTEGGQKGGQKSEGELSPLQSR